MRACAPVMLDFLWARVVYIYEEWAMGCLSMIYFRDARLRD